MKKLLLLVFIVLFSCSKDTPPSFLVSISSGVGGSVDTTGGEYGEGVTVTVRATADAEYEFVSWSNGSTDNPLVLTVSSNQTITATFQKKKYRLSVVAKGNGSVKEELVSAGRGDYSSGSVVKLTAVPDTGYYFTGWSGDVTGTDNPIDVTVGSEKEITATFEILVLDLEVIVKGEGQVSQAIVEGTGAENENRSTVTQYEYGTIVELTPTPSDGMAFISWSGDYLGEEDPLQLTMTESTSIQANFDYELLIKVVGKWKIKKKTQDRSRWSLYSIIFKRNYSYTINTSRGQVRGSFKVKSNSEIDLVGYGSLSNVDLTKNTTTNTWGNFRFRITVPGEIEEEEVATEVDNNYKPVVNEETGETVERTYVPDDNFEQTLIDLGYDDTLDDYVNTENINNVTSLENTVWIGPISDLTGIEDFVKLITLQADNMNLNELDVSNNIYLKNLSVHSNNLKSINFSNNIDLIDLILNDNEIEVIDLSNNNQLERIIIGGNNIGSIDVSNLTNLKKLDVRNSCSECSSMKIGSVDLSKNINLEHVDFYRNPLLNIDVSNNQKLKFLGLNDISSFDGNIDISNNPELEELVCSCNVTSLDISNNSELQRLSMAYNNLTQIDLSNNLKLTQINLLYNKLTSLDVSGNSLLNELEVIGNENLNCIQVSSDQLSNIPSNWTKDDNSTYSTDCFYNCSISVASVAGGGLNQSVSLGSSVASIRVNYNLDSCGDDSVYALVFDDQVPGVSTDFSQNGYFTISGTPTSLGTFNYSVSVSGIFVTGTSSQTTVVSGIISVIQPDSDLDGINDDIDSCPNTPAGQTVNSGGCSTSQIDSDSDGVNDNIDACSQTPSGESVNSTGCSNSQLFTVIAGGNGKGTNSNQLWYPESLFLSGNYIYIVDAQNRPGRVQKWEIGANQGVTVANNMDYPYMCYVDSQSNIFVTDRVNDKLKKFTSASADNPQLELTLESNSTNLNEPTGIIQQSSGVYYISDMRNNRVIKWIEGQTTGTVLFGGNGQGSNQNQLYFPHDIGFDSSGNTYVLDSGNYRVQKYSGNSTNGTTVAGGNGNGSGLNQIGFTMGFHVSTSGDIYLADRANQRIVKWPSGSSQGEVILSSSSGFGSIYPFDVYLDESTNYLYIVDTDNHRVVRYKITD